MEFQAGEQKGIELITHEERHGKPLDIFWMWFGGCFNVQMVAFGALLPIIGLSFEQSIIAIIIGNLSWVLTGLASLHGPAAGTTTFVIQRAPFGPAFAKVTTALNWVTQVTFEISSFILACLALIELAERLGVHVSTPLKLVLVAISAAIQLVLPIAGHRVIVRTMKLLTPLFGVMFVLLAILVIPKIHNLGTAKGGDLAVVFEGIAFVFAVSGFSWVANASDYTRYLPADTSRKSLVQSVMLGGFIPFTVLTILGAAVESVSPSASNPIAGMTSIFASWFVIPYLIIALVQLYSITSIDLYSSGVTLQALGIKIKRHQAVVVDLIFTSVISGVAIFSSNVNTFIADLLLFVMVWIAPWGAIFITDFFLRRGDYRSEHLFKGKDGIYWGDNGVHWPAVIALAIGAATSLCWLNTSIFVGPISHATGGSDLSSPIGFLVAGVLYVLLGHKSVARSVANAPAGPQVTTAVTPATVGELA
jgi:nucleobase:cation symporter-1, NCS1 family